MVSLACCAVSALTLPAPKRLCDLTDTRHPDRATSSVRAVPALRQSLGDLLNGRGVTPPW